LTDRHRNLPARFADEVIDGVRRERSAQVAAAVNAAIADVPATQDPAEEAAQYLPLCERAWLRWTRLALDAITARTLGQQSLGDFNPPSVRDAREAAQAEARCALHLQLLDLGPEDVPEPDWPWRLEAARQIHASTQKVLRVGSGIGPLGPRSVAEVYRGISCAADALVTAIAVGFVVDAAAEVRATVEAMVGSTLGADEIRLASESADEHGPSCDRWHA
jgi:hypothetical protein